MQKMKETQVQSLGQEVPLEEEMATHSSILAWKIPWTEESQGLQSMGSQSWTQLSMHTPCSIYFWSSQWRPQVPSIAVCLDMPVSRPHALTDRNGVD